MTAEEIQAARKAKDLYLSAFGVRATLNLLSKLISEGYLESHGAVDMSLGVLALGALVFSMVAAWRFCRALKFSKGWAAANVVFSVAILFQLIVLMRMYSKRTGTKLTFLLADGPPGPEGVKP